MNPSGSSPADLAAVPLRDADAAVRRQADFLAALNQTTLELVESRNVAELLRALVRRTSLLLHSLHAEIDLIESDDLVVRAFTPGLQRVDGERVTRADAPISWRAVDRRTPVVIDDYPADPASRSVYRDSGIRAVAVFPILREQTCLGVLSAGRTARSRPFSAEDIQEGQLLARMAALALYNAGIHETTAREAELRIAALRESEERFRAVFDASPIGIGLFALPSGTITELNTTAVAFFGYTRAEIVGRTTLELNVWVDPSVREAYVRELQARGFTHDFEAEMRRKDGTTFHVVWSGRLVTLAGQPYSLASLIDISSRKQSEAARDRSLALMRATLESTADAILVVNAHGHIETFNRNFAEMWRLGTHHTDDETAEAELIRHILAQLVAPERFLAGVRDLYSGSEDEIFDVLDCTDGRVFERYSRPQLLASRPAGRVWSFRDITDRLAAEAALRQSEERFRILAEVSPAGIFSTDPAGLTTFVNRRYCELSGLTPEAALGDGWKKALHPDDRAAVESAWQQAVEARATSAGEFRFVRPDGTLCWLVGQSRAHLRPDGTLAGYVGTVTDVTHLKLAEAQRQLAEAQLRQSHKMESLGTLAGGIAHDFNNILNGTFGFVDLARLDLPAGHPVHAWLDRIAASSQRARELVRQILTFSRKTEGSRTPQRLHLVVAEALRLLRSTLPAMVELTSHLHEEAPPVLADATQIHQVVLNLCTNAAQALPARGGRITVTLEAATVSPAQASALAGLRPGPGVRLAVTDNGSGMDAATLEHIFEPFFTTKDIGAGTGLGLPVVHGIVRSHDGAVAVQSTVGHGSTFEVFFPAVAPAPAQPAAPPAEIPRGHGERVLVVDDDAVSGFVIEKLVESLGYTVTRCTRPEEALARFAAAPSSYDLVVSDLAMPGMNGEELIGHLAQIRADLPIVVASGYLENARQRLLDAGIARAVLHKPVARAELARTLAAALIPRPTPPPPASFQI
jgi:PAS domain S-box-containing protein